MVIRLGGYKVRTTFGTMQTSKNLKPKNLKKNKKAWLGF